MMSLTAQASLLLAELGWQSKPLATIGVTSCHGREGVSTIARAMAGAAAPSGVSVVLADIGKTAAKRNSRSAAISDDESEDLGKPTSIDGLFVVDDEEAARCALEGAGGDGGFETLLGQLRSAYGLCIFDLPPILEDGRGASIAARLDSTIVVIESGRTSVSDLRRMERVLASNGAKVAGAVLNRYRD
jgi:Mrp family chromosome partitioning ATPase